MHREEKHSGLHDLDLSGCKQPLRHGSKPEAVRQGSERRLSRQCVPAAPSASAARLRVSAWTLGLCPRMCAAH